VEPAHLLVRRDVEEELHQPHAVGDQHALELVDLVVGAALPGQVLGSLASLTRIRCPGFEPGSNRRLLTFSKAFDYRLSAAPNKRSRENAGPAIPRSSQGLVDCSDAAGSTPLKLQGARRCPDERVSGMCSRRGDTK
jgi:hypothetical protein